MTCTVKKKGKQYAFSDESGVFGTRRNRTIFLLKRLTAEKNHDVVYEMRQESIIKKVFIRIFYLLTRTQVFPEFIIYKNGRIVGETKPDLLKGGIEKLYLDDSYYVLRFHTKNYISIFKNDSQIALLKKRDITYANQNEYTVSCERELYEDKAWLIMLVMFADTAFWSNNRMMWDAVRWEVTIGKDQFPEYLEWKPGDGEPWDAKGTIGDVRLCKKSFK